MKRVLIFTLMMAALLPNVMHAQDDMYFVPEKKTKAPKQVSSDVPYAGKTYYSGINKTDDEYNRRVKKVQGSIRTISDSLVYSADSVASDIIAFTPYSENKESESKPNTVVDTLYVYVEDAHDFSYSRYLSLFDTFYWNRYFYGPGWSRFWYWHGMWYDPWYTPWYGPWYDPFFDPWFDPWYDPWFTFYHPYHYGPWFNPWYGPGGYHYGPSYPHGGYFPGHEYAGKHPGRGGRGGVLMRKSGDNSVNNVVARRNGDRVNRSTNNMSRGWNSNAHNNRYNYQPRENYPSYNGGTSSRTGGFSGGGGYSSGGGGVSRSGGGGGHSGGRR